MLFGLGIRKQPPPWEGVALLAAGCLLLRGSMSLLRTVPGVPPAPVLSATDQRRKRPLGATDKIENVAEDDCDTDDQPSEDFFV